MKWKKTEIRIETRRTLVVRRRHIVRAWCEVCRIESEFVSWDQAIEILAPEIGNGSTLAKEIHLGVGSLKTGEQQILICLNSLLRGTNPAI